MDLRMNRELTFGMLGETESYSQECWNGWAEILSNVGINRKLPLRMPECQELTISVLRWTTSYGTFRNTIFFTDHLHTIKLY